MNQLALLVFVSGLAVGCSSAIDLDPHPDNQCADCCPRGDPGVAQVELRCRLVYGDGGAASGVVGQCTLWDAGGTSDETGVLAFTATQTTCGIAAGSLNCGGIRLTYDGGTFGEVSPYDFERDSCQMTVR